MTSRRVLFAGRCKLTHKSDTFATLNPVATVCSKPTQCRLHVSFALSLSCMRIDSQLWHQQKMKH